MQLPKNKFVRLGINIFIIVCWFLLSAILWRNLDNYAINNLSFFAFLGEYYAGTMSLLYLILFLIPSFLISRSIWFGRIKPRQRITRSKD